MVPQLGNGTFGQAGNGDLVPAHRPLAVVPDDLLRAADKLHVVVVRGNGGLITAEVEVRPGRQRRNFPDNVVKPLVHHVFVSVDGTEADFGTGV